MMKILVTGGRGTVGRVLVKELGRRGHEVASADVGHGEDEMGFSVRTDRPRPTHVRCDVGSYRQLRRVFDAAGPFDYVFHLAAEVGRWSGEDFYEQLWMANAVGTKNVIRLQEELGFRLVHFSSSEVYGDWPHLMVETVPDEHGTHPLNDYALSKWVNERQIRNSIEQHGTETVVVRLFNTYGPGERYTPYRSVNCRFAYCALMRIPFVVHRGHHRTSSYVTDTVHAVANLVERFRPGETYNVGSDQHHSIEELAELALGAAGAPASLVQYREPEVLTVRRKRVDNGKAVRDLGYRCEVPLDEGMRRTVAWLQRTYGVTLAGAAA